MKVYVTGNPLVSQDSLPIKLIPLLEKNLPDVEFMVFDPTEDFMPEDKCMIIIDTIINAKKVCLVEDIDKIELDKAYSLHDFDLGHNLKLMKKFGMVNSVKIIGLPIGIGKNDAVEGIKKILSSL